MFARLRLYVVLTRIRVLHRFIASQQTQDNDISTSLSVHTFPPLSSPISGGRIDPILKFHEW